MPNALIAPVAHAFTAVSAVLAYAHRPAAAVLALLAGLVCIGIAGRAAK
ncbi:hypothetical protein [Silvimonas soli]|nr:hypothetical protein [Silvimonas soli]